MSHNCNFCKSLSKGFSREDFVQIVQYLSIDTTGSVDRGFWQELTLLILCRMISKPSAIFRRGKTFSASNFLWLAS
jgi:hypothetical protein